MTPHYVTHFDQGYLARGVLMLESLIRHAPDAPISLIFHDPLVRQVVTAELGDRINLISQQIILDHFPALKAIRDSRAPWPFYATLKPAIMLYIAERHALPGQWVASVDSDTFFYSDPTPGYENLRNSQIAITPHRFSTDVKHGFRYGHFNAGFVMCRQGEIGQNCMRDWLNDCLQSCDPKGQFGAYMNQGYLNAWPTRYRRVRLLAKPTINLAPWNVGNHVISEGKSGPLVDGVPVIFYHFSGHERLAGGTWKRNDFPSLKNPLVDRCFHEPMEALLTAKIAELEAIYGAAPPRSLKQAVTPLERPVLSD